MSDMRTVTIIIIIMQARDMPFKPAISNCLSSEPQLKNQCASPFRLDQSSGLLDWIGLSDYTTISERSVFNLHVLVLDCSLQAVY